jgi:hypothetical protein
MVDGTQVVSDDDDDDDSTGKMCTASPLMVEGATTVCVAASSCGTSKVATAESSVCVLASVCSLLTSATVESCADEADDAASLSLDKAWCANDAKA